MMSKPRLALARMVFLAAMGVCMLALAARSSAAAYNNCQEVTASWYWATLQYCGPYPYEDNVLGSLTSTATSYVQNYYWGTYAELYWWARVTPYDEPGYYDAGFMVF